MTPVEEVVAFPVKDEQLLGILHLPHKPDCRYAMLLVVGGPQYRVGSHRQFVLLARALAEQGIAVLRFDYRGMGDSTGAGRDFEQIAEDIGAALDVLQQQLPGLDGVILWGLCDAASANAFYAPSDKRVVGQIALNPWVRTEQGEAQAYIKHYYLKRLISVDFWLKILKLQWGLRESLGDFLNKLMLGKQGGASSDALPERLRKSLTAYSGDVLFVISGRDLTAKEFESSVNDSDEWRQWMTGKQITVQRLVEADHTFSRRVWRDQVARWTADWIKAL